MNTVVMIPAHNEGMNIKRVVDELKIKCPQSDYVVINDGSIDNTLKVCRENGFNVINLPVNLGLSGAFRTGILYAYRNGYDAAVQLDGDGQHDPSFIPVLEAELEKGNNIVIGSRFVTQKKPHTMRMFGSSMISFAIKLTTGKTLTDPTSGMRLYDRDMICEFAKNEDYIPEPDTISFLIKNGVNVGEVQVSMRERIAGESYFSFGKSLKYMTNMFISVLFVQAFRRRGGQSDTDI